MLARATLILALAVPTLALAASGGPVAVGGPIAVVAPPTPAPAPPPTVAASATPPPKSPAPAADPSECRIGCADDRYACAASDHAEACAGAWSQCVAVCDAPQLDPGVSTAP